MAPESQPSGASPTAAPLDAADAAPALPIVRRRRRWLAPEVIQTSAMDCGPAALKCLLEGFGVSVSYGRLREACQTSVDGTSVDTLETLARMLGLDAEQVMVPVEHVVAPEGGADGAADGSSGDGGSSGSSGTSDSAGLLPAIAVVRLASGMTHFVVLWRRLGPYLQLMDSGAGTTVGENVAVLAGAARAHAAGGCGGVPGLRVR